MLPNVADQLGETLFDGKGMPGWFFTSNEVLEAEKDYFFRNSWLCIGLADDAKEPGDVYPVTILGQPLLVVRGRDAALRVFHNVCSHRGTQLISDARKCATIVCPYHAWAYGLDGQLKQTPHAGGFKRFPRLREDELGTGESMYVPANLILITMSDFMFANILIPESPDRTAERIEMFLIGEDAVNPDLQLERQKLMDMLAQVNNEDIGICELAQKGRGSEAFSGGVFAPAQEQSTLQFQQLVARRMLIADGQSGEALPELPVLDIHH